MIYRLIWRNLWRNRRRTLITIASVTFAVFLAVVMQSLQKGVFDNLVRNMVNYYSGYMQIHRQGYWKERLLDNSFSFSDSLRIRMLKAGDIRKYVPRTETFVLASRGEQTRGAFLCGTDPVSEAAMTRLNERVIAGEFLRDTNDPQVLLGEGLSRKLGLVTGDTVVLLGQGMYGSMAAGKYRIKGILKLGSPELNDAFILMDLKMAQDLLSAPGMLTAIAIEPEHTAPLEESVAAMSMRLGREYEVMSWMTMMPEVYNHIRIDTNSLYIMMGFLYLIIAFGMFGTILMMTNERRYEFGMLVAIGMKRGQLGRMLLSEIFLLAFTGALTGMLLSWPLVYYLQEYPLHFSGEIAEAYASYGFEPLFPAKADLSLFLQQAFNVLVLSLLMSVYPLYKVMRLDPGTQIRR